MLSIKEEIINYILELIRKEKNVDAIETTITIEDDEDNFLRGKLKMINMPVVVFYRYFDEEKIEPSRTHHIYIDRKDYTKKVRQIKLNYLEKCLNQEIK